VMNDDGTMARRPELETFGAEHGLMILSIADLIRYRLLRERMVERTAEVETEVAGIGRFKVVSYRTQVDDLEHLAIVKGQPLEDEAVLGRVHQENVLGDVLRCGNGDSRWRLEYALRQMEEAGSGVLVYLQKPAPRLENELLTIAGRAPRPKKVDRGAIGLPPDLREFGIGAQILLDQGVRTLRLITSSGTSRIKGIEGYGLEVIETLPIPPRPAADPAAAHSEEHTR